MALDAHSSVAKLLKLKSGVRFLRLMFGNRRTHGMLDLEAVESRLRVERLPTGGTEFTGECGQGVRSHTCRVHRRRACTLP